MPGARHPPGVTQSRRRLVGPDLSVCGLAYDSQVHAMASWCPPILLFVHAHPCTPTRARPPAVLDARAPHELRQRLSLWDKGGPKRRKAILADFVHNTQGMTAPQLERALCNGASLFLARLTAWLRMTYVP